MADALKQRLKALKANSANSDILSKTQAWRTWQKAMEMDVSANRGGGRSFSASWACGSTSIVAEDARMAVDLSGCELPRGSTHWSSRADAIGTRERCL